MSSGSLPDPPDGVRLATPADRRREAFWVFRSLVWERIFTNRTTAGQRAFSALIIGVPVAGIVYVAWRESLIDALVLGAAAVVAMAFVVVLLRFRNRHSVTRVYVLEEGTATMTITAGADYWTIAGHNRARRAKGSGEKLQDLLLPVMATAADTADLGIRLTAAAPRLADRYAAKLPGLLRVGAAFPYGIQMYRPSTSQRRALSLVPQPDAATSTPLSG